MPETYYPLRIEEPTEREKALAQEVVDSHESIARLAKSVRAWCEEAIRLAEERDLATERAEQAEALAELRHTELDEAKEEIARLTRALHRESRH